MGGDAPFKRGAKRLVRNGSGVASEVSACGPGQRQGARVTVGDQGAVTGTIDIERLTEASVDARSARSATPRRALAPSPDRRKPARALRAFGFTLRARCRVARPVLRSCTLRVSPSPALAATWGLPESLETVRFAPTWAEPWPAPQSIPVQPGASDDLVPAWQQVAIAPATPPASRDQDRPRSAGRSIHRQLWYAGSSNTSRRCL